MKQRTIMTKADVGKKQEKDKRQRLSLSLLTSRGFSHSYEKTRKSVGEEEKGCISVCTEHVCDTTTLHHLHKTSQDKTQVREEDANNNGDNRGKR